VNREAVLPQSRTSTFLNLQLDFSRPFGLPLRYAGKRLSRPKSAWLALVVMTLAFVVILGARMTTHDDK